MSRSSAIHPYTEEQVIAAYVKVLHELAVLKDLARAPEEVLPLPKDEMLTILDRSTHPREDQLVGLLAMFKAGATTDLFLARLVLRPTVLCVAYTIAIAVQGASWLWLLIALLGGIGGIFATSKWTWAKRWATLPRLKRWSWLSLITFGEFSAIACWGAVWVRLVIISGLYGLYFSVWKAPDWFGVFSALLSLVLGYFFSKQFNAFFFFVAQYTSRRQFRQTEDSQRG